MIANLKFYLLAAFFVVVLAFGAFTIFNQHKQIQAQAEAFKVFKKASEDERAAIFQKIDSLKETDAAQDIIIDEAQGARTSYEAELNELKKNYEKINFTGFSNDSLADYFANRRRARQR